MRGQDDFLKDKIRISSMMRRRSFRNYNYPQVSKKSANLSTIKTTLAIDRYPFY